MTVLYYLSLLVVAAVVVASANALALRPWRGASQAHWTERARLLWPARVGAVWNVLLGTLLVATLAECAGPETAPVWYVRILVGLVGAVAGTHFFDREVFPGFTPGDWARHMLAVWGLQVLFGGVLVAAMLAMPSELNARALTVGAVALGLLLALRLKLGVLLLRALRILRPADARLLEVAREASGPLANHVSGVWILGGPQAQAYALPVSGELWLSRRLLDILSEAELRAILAHEIAHLAESRLTVAGRVAATLVWWPLVFLPPALTQFGLGAACGLLLLCLALSRLSHRMSLRLEQRADDAAVNAQSQQGVYAAALEKLYRDNQLPAVNPKGPRTHPSLYDRLTAAGVVPGYPRPEPPERSAWTTKMLFGLWLLAMVCAMLRSA